MSAVRRHVNARAEFQPDFLSEAVRDFNNVSDPFPVFVERTSVPIVLDILIQ